APDYSCDIGSLLDVGAPVHVVACPAANIRKQAQGCDPDRSRISGPGPTNERERNSETGSPGGNQWQRKVPGSQRRTPAADRSRPNRYPKVEMGTRFARESRTGGSELRSPISTFPTSPPRCPKILTPCDTNFSERHARPRHSSFHSASLCRNFVLSALF